MRIKYYKVSVTVLITVIFNSCASTAPVQIGGNTYYSSKTNTAGIFGDVSAVAGSLMADGYKLCASKNKEFELVSKEVQNNVPGVRFGGASITFKCIDNSKNPIMRKDNGVTTIEVK